MIALLGALAVALLAALDPLWADQEGDRILVFVIRLRKFQVHLLDMHQLKVALSHFQHLYGVLSVKREQHVTPYSRLLMPESWSRTSLLFQAITLIRFLLQLSTIRARNVRWFAFNQDQNHSELMQTPNLVPSQVRMALWQVTRTVPQEVTSAAGGQSCFWCVQ